MWIIKKKLQKNNVLKLVLKIYFNNFNNFYYLNFKNLQKLKLKFSYKIYWNKLNKIIKIKKVLNLRKFVELKLISQYK